MKQKLKQTKTGKKDFTGIWHITKMSAWDNDYVNEEAQAFIRIGKSGCGEFHFGCVQGSMIGDFEMLDGKLTYDFTFEGNDECDPTSGDGWMRIIKDNKAEGKIRFHAGDTSLFWAKKK